jgi:hypothetical protein
MNGQCLREVRTLFVKLSGRNDLVNTDGSDNGANFYINAGQRFLDGKANFTKTISRVTKQLAAGQSVITVADCRAVAEVWLSNSTGRAKLEKKTLGWIRDQYPLLVSSIEAPLLNIADQDTDVPLYYTVAVSTLAPEQNKIDNEPIGTLYDMDSINIGDTFNLTSILLAPWADAAYSVTVFGHFFSPFLSNDADRSFWTMNYPDLLLFASLYKLEVSYRNSEGSNDWLRAINEGMHGVEMETALDLDSEPLELEG